MANRLAPVPLPMLRHLITDLYVMLWRSLHLHSTGHLKAQDRELNWRSYNFMMKAVLHLRGHQWYSHADI